MLAKHCPKVSLQSRLSREKYDAKFGMDECARNNYWVTLRMANFDENEASVDVILSNALIDIRFAPFPGTSVPWKKNAEFLSSPHPVHRLVEF